MKVKLECTERYEDPAYVAEMSFGADLTRVNVPAVQHYKGEIFTARNKREVQSALATGKWKIKI